MTKSDFIDRVADRSGLSKRDATKAVDAFLDSIGEALKDGDSVSFTGFGKFSARQREARQGVNPRTGERVQIPAATVPKFSAGSALKQASELRSDVRQLKRDQKTFRTSIKKPLRTLEALSE